MWRSSENAVFHLQYLTVARVDQQRIRAVAHPFESHGGHFKGEQPVVGQYILRTPKAAREDFAITPAPRRPARRAVVGADFEASGRLEIMLIGASIHRSGPIVPSVRLLDTLIAAGTGMRLRLVSSTLMTASPLAAGPLAATAVLMLGIGRRDAEGKQQA